MENQIQERRGGTRATELDGLRGWASLSVVLFHIVSETFGTLFPTLRLPIVQMFLNGNLAVCVFFILSGEALSIRYMETGKDRYPVSIMLKRYTRLTVPIFFSCLLTLLLYRAGLTFNRQAGDLVGRQDWLGVFLTQNISLKSFVQYCFVAVYNSVPLPEAFNVFLWTMPIELVGSVIVLLVLLSWEKLGNKLFLAMLASLFLQVSVTSGYISLFFIGMSFAWLRNKGPLSEGGGRLGNGVIPLAMIFVTLAVIVLCNRLKLAPFRVEQVFAPALVFFILKCRAAVNFLRFPVSQFLGTISFPIYLIHFSVIISVMSWMIVRASEDGVITARECASIIAITLAICVIAATMFLVVEKLTDRIGAFMVAKFARFEN